MKIDELIYLKHEEDTYSFIYKTVENLRPCDFCHKKVNQYFLFSPVPVSIKFCLFMGIDINIVGRVCKHCYAYMEQYGYTQFRFAFKLGLL